MYVYIYTLIFIKVYSKTFMYTSQSFINNHFDKAFNENFFIILVFRFYFLLIANKLYLNVKQIDEAHNFCVFIQ